MLPTQTHVPALVAELYACANACNLCYEACLAEDDVTAMAECIRRTRDCADMCLLTASFVARNSDVSERVKKLCHDLCLRCEMYCSKMPHKHCKDCAEA